MSDTPETSTEPDKVTISVDRDGFTGALQINIGKENARGYGHGYRIAGPKYLGASKNLRQVQLGERDAREIFEYIRPLLGEDWLRGRVATGGDAA